MPQEIVAIAFDKPTRATEALIALAPLQANRDIDLDDAVVVTRDAAGKVRLQQTVDSTPGKGAAWGGWLGFLIGLIFLVPLGGVLLGMAAGAVMGKLVDHGLDDNWMKEVSEAIPPGGSALFLLVNYAKRDAALAELARFKGEGRILSTTLSDDVASELEHTLEKEHAVA
jgi:uncharacterized membrane protein